MRFVIKSSCTDCDDTGNVAIVDLDKEALQDITTWRALYEDLKTKYSIIELPFWWRSCWWFDACPFYDEDSLRETPFTEEQLDALERDEWVRVPDDFWLGESEEVNEEVEVSDDDDDQPPGTLKECITGADRVVITDRGVFFKAHVKYSDSDDVETWILPYDAFICPIHGIDKEAEATCLRCIAAV